MTTEQIKTEFYAFLKKHKALIKFKRSFKEQRESDTLFNFFKRNEESPGSFIDAAFTWYRTSQDYKFWSDLNEKWVEHYNTLTK